jgi:Ca2+-binding RTX toxin-like protein
MTIFKTELLRPSDHPLLHTWTSKLWGVRTANYSSSERTISLGITSANLQFGTAAVVARAGGTGQESIWFNRVLGSTLAGDRVDFSSLDPRSMFVGYSPTSPLGVKANLATGSVVIGSIPSFGSTVSWGCLVQNFEDVTGSAFDDILIGNADSNKIIGGAGNDTLDGGVGVDVLTGGSGNDQFTLANRGGLNADNITDFKAYIVKSQPGSPAGSVIEDDALIFEVGAFYWTVLAPDIVNPGREEQGSVSV